MFGKMIVSGPTKKHINFYISKRSVMWKANVFFSQYTVLQLFYFHQMVGGKKI